MTAGQVAVVAIIVAGGKSSRMGRDKAQIIWRGETLLERTMRVCREAGLSPIIIAGRVRPAGWDESAAARFVADETPDAGPLGGLATGLQCVAEPLQLSERLPFALVLSCDMPLLSADAVRWLAEAGTMAAQEGAVGVATLAGGKVQPLFAVYSAALLPDIRQRLEVGRRSLVGLIESRSFLLLEAPAEIAAAIRGVNTPEELAALQ